MANAVTIDELLRIDPPLHLFTRYVLEDLEFGGARLKKGQTIGSASWARQTMIRPSYPDPQHLDFKRGGEGHVSFGAGIHFCLGAPLARLEMAYRAFHPVSSACPILP